MRQIDDLDELVAVDDAFAPDGVEIVRTHRNRIFAIMPLSS